MMRKIWVNKAKSLRKAEEFDLNYYLAMSGMERLKIVQFLREVHRKLKKGFDGKSRKGLRRIIKIIQ
jgi:hypothetical protein